MDDAAELAGLSPEEIATAAAAAADRGLEGYLLTLVLPTGQPLLPKLRNRELRRRVFEASIGRASAGEHDNGPVAVRIALLRAERARLLGFDTHADVVLADSTAGTTGAVDAMLASMVPASVANAEAEAKVLAEVAARDGVELAAWDWSFYAERVRAERYAVDTAALRPWFELDRVLVDGVFHAAELLYGYRFTPRPDLAGYHPDVRVWEVTDADGTAVGLYLGDFFAREGKRGGAWMSSFVRQSRLLGTPPVVVNNLNVNRAAGGQPTLLTLDEVEHPLPRVRPRPARAELGGDLSALLGHQRAARLRGVPEPGQRDVGDVAGGARALRPARGDRGAAARLRRRGDRGRPAVGRGLRHAGVPGRDAARPGVAPDRPGHGDQ